MFKFVVVAGFFAASFLCQRADAQAPTTVQLPSFSFFTYNGTVLVPDRGSTYLGGVSRAASGARRRGPSIAMGSEMSRSDAVASVRIIDLNEMDRQVLGGTPKEFLARMRAQEAAAGKKQRDADPNAEGKALVRYARKQYKEGNRTIAFDTYMMAMEVLSPNLRDLAMAEFKRTFGPAAAQAANMRRLTR